MKDTPVVFDIDSFDVGQTEVAYFKRNGAGTTVENLVNFELDDPLLKSIYVGRIVRYIIRTLDMSDLHGRNYTVYQKVRAEKMLEDPNKDAHTIQYANARIKRARVRISAAEKK